VGENAVSMLTTVLLGGGLGRGMEEGEGEKQERGWVGRGEGSERVGSREMRTGAGSNGTLACCYVER
jgi:hypothetical protein